MAAVQVLRTGRLELRSLDERDLDELAAMYADPETMRYIGTGRTLDRGETWRQIALHVGHWHLRGYGMWAVVERASGVLVGRMGLWNPEGWPALEAGWLIARERWGEGFATEGAHAVLDYAFEAIKIPHIVSFIHPDNAASLAVARNVGETLEGTVMLNGTEHLVFGCDSPAAGRSG